MEQPKILVTTDGEIDISAIDEVVFVTLYDRLLEIRREKQNLQAKEAKKEYQ